MERLIVQSDVLFSVGYNAGKNDLEIQFQDGSMTRFLAVPPAVYLDFMNAEEKDDFYNRKIKDRYVFRKFTQPEQETA